MTVIVNGGRISTIGRAGSVRVPQDAVVVDGTEKFLIPGLWDMHVHVGGYQDGVKVLPRFVGYGQVAAVILTGRLIRGADLQKIR